MRRSLHVAYATLLRSLLPFFHGGRPKYGPEEKKDLWASEYREGEWGARERSSWPEHEKQRLFDADKLAAHLSGHRGERESDWGSDEDLCTVELKVRRLLEEMEEGRELFPKTVSAL